VLVVCVGGGGLIAGCALAATATGSTRVVGVEPAAGDDVRQSLRAGERVTIPVPRTIADGQQTTSPGALNFPIIQRLVDDVVTVTDEEIVAAMVVAFERMKVVLEPSGASALAAVLSGHVPGIAGKRVGITLSGGNIGAARFAELVGARS
jgi:threonine dehydratase